MDTKIPPEVARMLRQMQQPPVGQRVRPLSERSTELNDLQVANLGFLCRITRQAVRDKWTRVLRAGAPA